MYLKELLSKAKQAKYDVQKLTKEQKNNVLLKVADAFIKHADIIISENEKDIAYAVEKGMSDGLIDRLRLTLPRIEGMSEGLRQITDLEDPTGRVLEEFKPANGLHVKKVSVPLGLIGVIYESRPNVTADAFGLCFMAGNAVVLKGGSDAIHSNRVIVKIIREVLEKEGHNPDILSFVDSTKRETVMELMKMNEYIDVLIPRGGASLIQSVVNNSTIPFIETGTGNCHIYVDDSADLNEAVKIILNAKTQRIGVCNACESLLIHNSIYESFLPTLEKALKEKNVEIRADEISATILKDCIPATEEDYYKEYLDYIISIKIVNNVDEAITHINKYNTHHSDAILTKNMNNAEKFLNEVDSACVYVNASTRFTDGFEFGFGAEIGISTQKLHARGPMGLKELNTYKYEIIGNGQIRG